jgi:hypothetical protein
MELVLRAAAHEGGGVVWWVVSGEEVEGGVVFYTSTLAMLIYGHFSFPINNEISVSTRSASDRHAQ